MFQIASHSVHISCILCWFCFLVGIQFCNMCISLLDVLCDTPYTAAGPGTGPRTDTVGGIWCRRKARPLFQTRIKSRKHPPSNLNTSAGFFAHTRERRRRRGKGNETHSAGRRAEREKKSSLKGRGEGGRDYKKKKEGVEGKEE